VILDTIFNPIIFRITPESCLQIDSHASRTPLSIAKFGRGHASRWQLSNLPSITQDSKLTVTVRCKKAQIFVLMSKISLVSRQILAGFLGHASHPVSV
jgi:hypothetical protein